ncbi:MAG: carboxypeptidase-like regulatory domain-containing protein [Gemmatimonadaceae bacterium]|nr:carboxypeptidase regulatory-like domain-containing protein [Gemmatimonadaceae bacterium]MBX9855006.1 carboxypeptidase-like regulatory domain-containing protein [Gemmatimonadaceae bacterium]
MSDPASPALMDDSQKAGMVIGRVLADGHAAAEATVMIVEGDTPHPDIASITDTFGAFQLGGLSPGWYNLEARIGPRTGRRSVQLGAGESAWVEFDLR